MSTTTRARRGGGGGGVRQFPVGRRRYVPVVDAGCGCRPRRPRLLGLPSFLKSGCQLGGMAAVVRSGGGQQYSSSYTTSTASFSSSCAATHSTGYSSAYFSDNYYSTTKPQEPQPALSKASPARKKELSDKKVTTKKKRQDKTAAAEAEEDGVGVGMGVGVAVEKESCDPRADFRESMVQMVVEMGLCDWDGLRCMLRRLLALNAPRHHAAILTAFAEVCAQIIATSQPSPPAHTAADR